MGGRLAAGERRRLKGCERGDEQTPTTSRDRGAQTRKSASETAATTGTRGKVDPTTMAPGTAASHHNFSQR